MDNILKTFFMCLIFFANFLAWMRLMVLCLWNHRWPSLVEILMLVILFLVGVIINPTRGS